MRISYLQKEFQISMSCTTYTESNTVSSHIVRLASARPLTGAETYTSISGSSATPPVAGSRTGNSQLPCYLSLSTGFECNTTECNMLLHCQQQAATQEIANSLSTYPSAQDMSVNPSTWSYLSTVDSGRTRRDLKHKKRMTLNLYSISRLY